MSLLTGLKSLVTLKKGDAKPVGDSSTVGVGSDMSKNSRVLDPFAYYATSDVFPELDAVLNRTGKPVSALRDLLFDTHLASLWGVRKSPVTRGTVSVTGELSPAVRDFYDAQISLLDIPRLISFLMDSLAYGIAGIEFMYELIDGKLYITGFEDCNPDWFVYTKDGWKMRVSQFGDDYKDFPKDRIGLFVNNPTSQYPQGERLFTKAYWMVVFKRKGVEWWTMALEKFGVPFIVGRVPNNTPDDRKRLLLGVLEKLLSAGVAVMNDSEDIEIMSGNVGRTTVVSYEGYTRFVNNELSKLVLGQTLTSDVGATGSRAVASVHNKIRMNIVSSDMVYIARHLTNIFRFVGSLNFAQEIDGVNVSLEAEEETSIERVQRDKILFEMAGVVPNAKYLDVFGLREDYYGDATGEEDTQGAGGD